jgi:hypothetical protein
MFSLLKPRKKVLGDSGKNAGRTSSEFTESEGRRDPATLQNPTDRTASSNPFSKNTPAREQPMGAFMRFQYGSGDTPLDGYSIKRGVGVGGFGEVYFAESDSGKEVALKRIQKNLDVEMRGVRHCLNLRHPNLVAIYDIRFDKDQQGWIVMEFIEGESLRETLDQWPQGMHAESILPLFSQIVAGVTYLHDQGIVHRDLKPANIFIENEMAKIGDYGLSKYISASRRGGQTESVGTFHYMAPEIGKGEYGKEIDIYSLGIILFEMLTGDVPFDGESTQEILLKHLTADPDLSRVPPRYAEVIGRALAKNPASRYSDGRELLQALGYELTVGGLATKAADFDYVWSTAPATAHAYAGSAQQKDAYGRASYDAGSQRATYAAGGTEMPPNSNAAANPSNSDTMNFGARVSAFFSIGLLGHQRMIEREPIASWLIKAWNELQFKYQSMPKGGREFVLIFVCIALFLNLTVLTAAALPLAWSYAVYYVIWFLNAFRPEDLQPVPRGQPFRAREPKPRKSRGRVQYVHGNVVPTDSQSGFGFQETVHYRNQAAPQPIAASVVNPPAPLSSREALKIWQNRQRSALRNRGPWTAFHAWIRSLSVSGFVVAILTSAGGYLALSNERLSQVDGLGGLAWLGIMSGLTSWSVLTLSRRWEALPEDSIAFRFALMVAGLLLGAASFQLSEYLLVPWGEITRGEGVRIGVSFEDSFGKTLNRSWKGFYDSHGIPMLAGHMAYFGTLLWAVRWWKQSDSLRRKRFSLWPIFWSVLVAAIIQGIFYFPTPWCLLMAGLTSFAIQIASPWIEPHSQPSPNFEPSPYPQPSPTTGSLS